MAETKYTANRLADVAKKRAEEVAANRDAFQQGMSKLKTSGVDLGDKALSQGFEYAGKTDKIVRDARPIITGAEQQAKIAAFRAERAAQKEALKDLGKSTLMKLSGGADDVAKAGARQIPGVGLVTGIATALQSGDLLAATPIGESTDSGAHKGSPEDLLERGKINPNQYEQTLRDNSSQPILKPELADGGIVEARKKALMKMRSC